MQCGVLQVVMNAIKLIVLVLTSFLALPGAANDLIRLTCTGAIETEKDGLTQPTLLTTASFVVDVTSSTIEIKGEWGCLADLGSLGQRAKKHCFGRQPIRVSDSEFRYSAESDSDEFEGSSSFILNRYSGQLSVSGSGSAKPAANAVWRALDVTARLQCARQQRSF